MSRLRLHPVISAMTALHFAATTLVGLGKDGLAPCWRVVAASDQIVAGELTFSSSSMDTAERAASIGFIEVVIRVDSSLKGESQPGSELTINYAPRLPGQSVQVELIRALRGKRVIALLQQVDPPGRHGLYFAEVPNQCSSLEGFSEARSAQIAEEVVQQQRDLASAVLCSEQFERSAVFERVKKLRQSLVKRKRQAQSISALEGLGHESIPALIVQMDDMRRLPTRHIAVRTADRGAFESTAHYQPEVVADALAVILGGLTGEDFGALANGTSYPIRRRTIDGWRLYLFRTYCNDHVD